MPPKESTPYTLLFMATATRGEDGICALTRAKAHEPPILVPLMYQPEDTMLYRSKKAAYEALGRWLEEYGPSCARSYSEFRVRPAGRVQ